MPSTHASTPSSGALNLSRLTRAERAELLTLLEERERRQTRRAATLSEPLRDFIPRVSPHFVAPDHLAPVLALFERIRRGERVRACVSIPSQHGKSFTVLHGIAWLLAARPSWPIIYVSYQQDQSDDHSHKARDIARRAGVDLAPDRQNLRMWRTTQGGGCLFTSIDGPGAGQPAQVAIVDDPYKNRSAAMSAATRRAVRDTFTGVVLQRGQEGMSIIVVHTRWLDCDLIGDIEGGEFGPVSTTPGDGGWEIVNLPMLALDDGSPAPRPYDRAVCVLNPRRTLADGRVFGWSLEGAQQQLRNIPETDAESMYQGKPRRRVDGALWTWDTIRPWRLTAEPPRSRCEVYVDPNASDDAVAARADDAGIVTIARGVDGRAYVLDDASGHVGVDGWAARAVASYRAHKASAICAESDGGGAMVEKTIRAWLLAEALEKSRATGRHVEPENVMVRLVRVGARGDKRGRAETVRHLYGDPVTGRPSVVSHVGHHDRLERSMTTHDFATTRRSPGDLDALSLGLAELMLTGGVIQNRTPPRNVSLTIPEAF